MHTFLRAIGFSEINSSKALDSVIKEVIKHPDRKIEYKINADENFTEIKKLFGVNFGIIIRGVYDDKGLFHMEHYFPFLEGEVNTIRDELTVSKKSENRAFSVMCDDVRLGVLLIFYLQNAIDYIRQVDMHGEIEGENTALLSGLSIEGKIILPVQKKDSENNINDEKKNRNKMIFEARNGDEEAMEKLAVEDIDLYMEINNRIKDEDIYSIVDTSFYPFGSESDNYSIIGTILDYTFTTNEYSGEIVYLMLIECNDLIFNICINQMDLYGTPMVGARFKGNVWIQGKVEFM